MVAPMKTHAAFVATVIIGGANFVAVTYSNMELPPLFGAALRFALAAVVLLVLIRVRGLPLARGRAARGAALYGLLGFGAGYALLYYSLMGLAAGTAAVIVAAAPLATLFIAVVLGQERPSVRGVAGGLLAVMGIGVLSTGTLGGGMGPSYVIAAVMGTLALAGSSVVARARRDVHPLSMNAIGMAVGTAFLVAGSLVVGEAWSVPRGSATVLAVAWLVVLGSVGMFQLFLYVIKRWSASATVYSVAAMPVVAVLLGAMLLDQPVTLEVVAGGVLVLAAVYLGAMAGGGQGAPARAVPGDGSRGSAGNGESASAGAGERRLSSRPPSVP
jgi:drug/metabolite transporter (DMT)-like permease